MTTSTKDAFRRVENSVHRLSEEPRRKIECLVDELMTLHKKLLTDGDHIQLDIEGYAELNLHVMTTLRPITAVQIQVLGAEALTRRMETCL